MASALDPGAEYLHLDDRPMGQGRTPVLRVDAHRAADMHRVIFHRPWPRGAFLTKDPIPDDCLSRCW